jgi:hypothetical protein
MCRSITGKHDDNYVKQITNKWEDPKQNGRVLSDFQTGQCSNLVGVKLRMQHPLHDAR